MTLDNFLLWLSSMHEGSWAQFRSAIERLNVDPSDQLAKFDHDVQQAEQGSDLPIYQHVRYAMQRLGHVEFFAAEIDNGWRVVPPSIVFQSEPSAHAILCGARSPEILEDLHALSGTNVEISGSQGGPSRICLRGPTPRTIAKNLIGLGFHVQHAASTTILASLPGARDFTAWLPSTIPENTGWTVHRFSRSRLQWTEDFPQNASRAAYGLFRFRLGFQRLYFLRWRGRCYSVNVQVGKYAVLRRRAGLLRYNRNDQIFSVPPMCRPPPLIDRALILCSGLLPRLNQNSQRLEYTDVPPEVVRIAAQLLRQEAR